MSRDELPQQAVILCGGRGLRAYPLTETVPKPLIDVAGRPLVSHVIEGLRVQGIREFILASGYRAEMVAQFVADAYDDRDVWAIDTGEIATSGDRLKQLVSRLQKRFLVTYCDVLGNVEIKRLGTVHARLGCAVTLTTVALPAPFGVVSDDGRGIVTSFEEKPLLAQYQINAGYMICEQRAFEFWRDGVDFEHNILPLLVRERQLAMYRHTGFWIAIDTPKDVERANRLAQDASTELPWIVREGEH